MKYHTDNSDATCRLNRKEREPLSEQEWRVTALIHETH